MTQINYAVLRDNYTPEDWLEPPKKEDSSMTASIDHLTRQTTLDEFFELWEV